MSIRMMTHPQMMNGRHDAGPPTPKNSHTFDINTLSFQLSTCWDHLALDHIVYCEYIGLPTFKYSNSKWLPPEQNYSVTDFETKSIQIISLLRIPV